MAARLLTISSSSVGACMLRSKAPRLGSFAVNGIFRAALSTAPANLTLADPSLVMAPREVPQLPDYSFPILNVPQHTVVKSFLKPGDVSHPAPLQKTIFEVAIRRDILLDAIRYTRHKQRQPKKTKRMSELRGSNKKPRPQKGTGSSQVGHRRNSAWRGGQKAHGPVIRDYSISMNKKTRALAMMMALSAKFREGNLFVFDSFAPPTHETKVLSGLLKEHGLNIGLTLFVDATLNENFDRAVGNVSTAEAIPLEQLNTYEVIRRDKLAISADAFQQLQDQLLSQYQSTGKRGAMQRSLKEYQMLVAQGRTLLSSKL